MKLPLLLASLYVCTLALLCCRSSSRICKARLGQVEKPYRRTAPLRVKSSQSALRSSVTDPWTVRLLLRPRNCYYAGHIGVHRARCTALQRVLPRGCRRTLVCNGSRSGHRPPVVHYGGAPWPVASCWSVLNTLRTQTDSQAGKGNSLTRLASLMLWTKPPRAILWALENLAR